MPRKRKALPAVDEEPPEESSRPQHEEGQDTVMDEATDEEGIERIVQECREQGKGLTTAI
jgi:hypothetical protein